MTKRLVSENHPCFTNEDIEMIASIRSLPIIPIPYNLTSHQKGWYELKVLEWDFISKFIAWQQLQELGYSSEQMEISFPKEIIGIQESVSLLLAKASIYFSSFQLIIECFEEIKRLSIRDGREFTFLNARKLFAKILCEISEIDSQDAFSKENNQGCSITEMKRGFTQYRKFWSKKLDKDKNDKHLEFYRHSRYWCEFWVFVIWDYYYSNREKSKKFKFLWDRHLESLQHFSKLISKPNAEDEIVLGSTRWSHGYAFDAKSGRPILYSP